MASAFQPAPSGALLPQIQSQVDAGFALVATARAAFHAGDRPLAVATLAKVDGVHYQARRSLAQVQKRAGHTDVLARRIEQLGAALEALRWRAERTA
jgi:hypothetical protein